MSVAKLTVKLVIVIVLISGTFFTVKYLKDHKPVIARVPKEKISYLVEASPVELVSEPIVMQSMGTVIPVRETTIKPRVSGKVIEVADQFRPGGYFEKGQSILKIDRSDYELAVQMNQAQLASAQATLALEMGRQEVASREWELVGDRRDSTEQEKALALRQPQLMQARANVDIAKSNLDNSTLNLGRTDIVAPYNCIVLTKNVELGTNVGSQDAMVSLVDVDSFWIEVSIPQDELKWVMVPHLDDAVGSKAVITYGSGDTVDGTVVSLLSDLENKGRMARVLVEVKDPFDLKGKDKRMPLLLDNYVKVDIVGRQLDNVVIIPRTAYRDGSQVWIVARDADGNEMLEIRDVKTIWRDETRVIVSKGISTGELLITSAIASPVNGMSVRVSQESK